MKQKISITLSSDLVKEVDRSAGRDSSRSEFIENVVREHFRAKMREAIDARDLELINANLDALIRQTRGLDEYEAPIEWEEEDETRGALPSSQADGRFKAESNFRGGEQTGSH